MSKSQTVKYREWFRERGLEVTFAIEIWRYFSLCQAKVRIQEANFMKGETTEFVAEGIARRSNDKHNVDLARGIAEGRALKALYLKIQFAEEAKMLETRGNEIDKRKVCTVREPTDLQEQMANLSRRQRDLVHGRIHLFMA